jgi:glycosyltransferase involved in cell wall biosynthesis
MKIAVVLEAVFPANKGGLERWYFHLASGLSELGHHVDYLNSAKETGLRNGIRYQSVTTYNWKYLEGGVRSIRQALFFTFSLCKWFSQKKYDVVYISSVPVLSIFSVIIIKIRNPKCKVFVEWLEYWPLPYWKSYKGYLIGVISWVIQFVSLQLGDYRTTFIPRTKNRIQARNLPFIRSRTILMAGLVNDDLIISKANQIERGDIVFVGRLVAEKQPLYAIKVISLYIKQGWCGNFWIVGTGPEEMNLRDAIFESGHSDQIHLLVDASDKVVNEKLKSSFLLLHPSKREGYGLVVVEAACVGLPTLLINYPENGAVDLGVNPGLIAGNDNLGTILDLIGYAESNKEVLSSQAISWAEQALKYRTMSKTVAFISESVKR